MQNTADVYAKVEPNIRKQAVVASSTRLLPDYSMMSQEQFNAEMEKGLADINAGRTKSAKQVREIMQAMRKP